MVVLMISEVCIFILYIYNASTGPEYGTTEAAWKGVLMEAEQRCDLHMRVKENLINDVHSNVKQWQRDNFHKVRKV